MATIDELFDELASRVTPEVASQLGAAVVVDVVGAAPTRRVFPTPGGTAAACTFRFHGREVLRAVVEGTTLPSAAVTRGSLEVQGDLGVAMRFERLVLSPKAGPVR